MKDNKIKIYTAFSILIVVLSFVIYYGFSDTEKTAIQNTAFIFTIISEILFFTIIYLVTRQKENTFSRAGISIISVIYFIVSLILNVIMKTTFETVRALVTTNLIILILYIAIILIIYLFKKEK